MKIFDCNISAILIPVGLILNVISGIFIYLNVKNPIDPNQAFILPLTGGPSFQEIQQSVERKRKQIKRREFLALGFIIGGNVFQILGFYLN